MNPLERWFRAAVRGTAVSRLLRRFDIDPHRYWLLTDLFSELTERREMFGHLGRDGVSLRTASLFYSVLTGLISLVQVLLGVSTRTYIGTFLGLSGFLLFTILLSETANSLVNPVEGVVLAHQPINGATYTAAKLTHLLRVLAYTVPALNLIPALAGFFLPHATWSYPLLHFTAASLLGLLLALCCCALFGWLIRLFPPARLKIVGQVAESAPLLLLLFASNVTRIFRALDLKVRLGHFDLPPATLHALQAALAVLALGALVFGLRALSGDYLVRVSAIMHARGAKASARRGKTRLAAFIARLAGGAQDNQPARAGFEYVRRLAFRDWQFRRQLIPMLPFASAPVVLLFTGARKSPFEGPFSAMHILPHAIGTIAFFICTVLAFGSDYKGNWIFLCVPNTTFHGFVRGVHAFLCFSLIVIPHAAVYAVLLYQWGPRDASIFIAFSLAASFFYLALTLPLVEGLPFGQPVDTSRGAVLLPIMIGCGLVMSMVVALQHYVLFHSRPLVCAVTLLTATAAVILTRRGLDTFEVAIRYHLGQTSQESTLLYKEVL
ncbi:MAG: hypothetical protein ABI759_03835 [Candidatus Solibacter sp.]